MSDAPSGGVLDTLRGLLVTGIALAKVRLELLSTEVREEKARLLAILAYGGAAIFLLAAGAVFLAVFLTVLLWDSHRLLVLGLAAAVFLLAGAGAAMTARRLAGTPAKLFEASLEELKRDQLRAEVSGKSQSP